MHVADPRRLLARMEFLRALAARSRAMRDLYRRQVGIAGNVEPVEVFRRAIESGVHGLQWPGGDEDALVSVFGERRMTVAKAWAAQWKLSVPWLHAWATYALARWEVGRVCRDPRCPHRCRATDWTDLHAAFTVALSDGRLYLLPEGEDPGGRYLAIDVLDGVEWIGPNPLLETKVEFVRRAEQTWDAAREALARQGIAASWPRALKRHCVWLVRFHVLRQTAADISDTRRDSSTVYKAVRQLAHLIDLPIRRRT